jgi:hypothetical protein
MYVRFRCKKSLLTRRVPLNYVTKFVPEIVGGSVVLVDKLGQQYPDTLVYVPDVPLEIMKVVNKIFFAAEGKDFNVYIATVYEIADNIETSDLHLKNCLIHFCLNDLINYDIHGTVERCHAAMITILQTKFVCKYVLRSQLLGTFLDVCEGFVLASSNVLENCGKLEDLTTSSLSR